MGALTTDYSNGWQYRLYLYIPTGNKDIDHSVYNAQQVYWPFEPNKVPSQVEIDQTAIAMMNLALTTYGSSLGNLQEAVWHWSIAPMPRIANSPYEK